jgi:hypothetical protein
MVSPMVLDAAVPYKGHALALLEGSVTVHRDRGKVKPENLAVVSGDPSIALVVLEPSHRAGPSDSLKVGPPDVEISLHGLTLMTAQFG